MYDDGGAAAQGEEDNCAIIRRDKRLSDTTPIGPSLKHDQFVSELNRLTRHSRPVLNILYLPHESDTLMSVIDIPADSQACSNSIQPSGVKLPDKNADLRKTTRTTSQIVFPRVVCTVRFRNRFGIVKKCFLFGENVS